MLIIDAAAPLFRRKWSDWCDIGSAAVSATVVVEEDTLGAVSKVGDWLRFLHDHEDRLILATSAAEIRQAKVEGKTAVILHFQSSRPVGYDIQLVEPFHRMGVRIMQLAYNVRGPLGDGCLELSDAGLSSLGKLVVSEMNRLGMVVDLSHAGIRTCLEAIEASTDPVVCTHSNARAICDHPRNLTDEQIRAVASSGGVVGVNAYPAFVKSGEARPSVGDLLDHIEHISALVGAEHVGLGLDLFEATTEEYERMITLGIWQREQYPPPPYLYPSGIAGASEIPNIAAGLRTRGFSREAIQLVMGGSFFRLFEGVWPGAGGGAA
jgi:membrane dipeptidase